MSDTWLLLELLVPFGVVLGLLVREWVKLRRNTSQQGLQCAAKCRALQVVNTPGKIGR
jgi:hypothetical protein